MCHSSPMHCSAGSIVFTSTTCLHHLVIKVSEGAGHHLLVSDLHLNLRVQIFPKCLSCAGWRCEDKHHAGLRGWPRSNLLQRELPGGRNQTHLQSRGDLPGDCHWREQPRLRDCHALPACDMWAPVEVSQDLYAQTCRSIYLDSRSFQFLSSWFFVFFLLFLLPAFYHIQWNCGCQLTQYSTVCALSLHRTCSPPITKQTSETEQIPLHLDSSRLMLHRLSAHGSHCSFTCTVAGLTTPSVFQGVTDVPELTYWSGSATAPTNLSILCASRTNRATAGSEVPRMKNNMQMAANGPRTGESFEHTSLHTHTHFFFSIWKDKVVVSFSFCSLRCSAWSSLCDVYVCLSRSAGVYPSLSSLCGGAE